MTVSRVGDHGDVESWCPLANPDATKANQDNLRPSKDFTLDASLEKQLQRLSAAVNGPTESFDDNGDVDDDPRWKTFDRFHDTLKDLFPLIHDRSRLEKVNRYGLVYTFKGTSQHLKPILLTAHEDVLPASSISNGPIRHSRLTTMASTSGAVDLATAKTISLASCQSWNR